ncbi:LacI family DNA-binding transcriptional regulator [Curtobacterium sp. ZW137]|uniref:LacI family DNA-binding transcriptional regulator n=1 Tax=Curtobacterium sp. ZW137 TaxID=2485104 RepID=UPI000F4C8590|nr:LacI family DNA-binding transcriptional regulator [Curtobacterium sp. ZW137]ROP63740.1 LacI family transcriptional regulator [Curtobacterium sp. ZW137]
MEPANDFEAPKRRRGGARTPAGSTSLAQVAQVASVSEATVSRVLNRKYGVSASTRQAVEDALKQVGYERPLDDRLVLMLTPNLKNPIFAQQAERVENELSPYGLKSIICPVYPGTPQERDYVESLVDAGVAAIVFLSSSNTLRDADHRVLQLIESRGIPYVSINGGFPDVDSPVVSTDDWRAAELAVGHLHDLGHRRVGLAAGPVGNVPADRRVEGFLQALGRRGVAEPEAFVVRQHFNIEGGQQAASALLAHGVTGIVASSDEMALGAYRAVDRAGLRVPHDVSVVGYDDSPMLDFTAPPLTTVRQPVERIAENVGRLVTSLIGHREVSSDEILVEPELRLRGSTGPVRPADV